MNGPVVVTLPGQERLAARLAAALSTEMLGVERRRFPDGESYLRIHGECRDRDVVVAATLARPDPIVLPLLLLAHGLRAEGARTVVLAAPYLAYMRQDRQFQSGEVVTSRGFAELLSAAFDGVVTVDPHLHRFHALSEIYRVPTRVAHAAPALAAWIAGNVDKPLIVGPDSESEQWVSEVARLAASPHVVLSKTRRGDREVTIDVPPLDRWLGRTPVLVDDIISTARTMVETVGHLVRAGYPAPVCVGVHAIFADRAHDELQRSGAAEIATADTVAHPTNRIDLSTEVAAAVASLLRERSDSLATAEVMR
ncbi:MAG: ribose-phosphate diphosphokinase [Pseudomonadales bacterium]